MPLIHSSSKPAFKANVKTLMDEVGDSPHVNSPAQALAIAYSVKRRGKAAGGPAPWYTRNEARGMVGHVGPIHSVVPGRTDHLGMKVPAGSYVIPADVISGLGQGNSMAGQKIVQNMFASGPYGTALPSMTRGRRKFADGGAPEGDGPVEIMAAGGEHVLSPEQVMVVGNGDLDFGHKILDRWVVQQRKNLVKTLRKLPGPSR